MSVSCVSARCHGASLPQLCLATRNPRHDIGRAPAPAARGKASRSLRVSSRSKHVRVWRTSGLPVVSSVRYSSARRKRSYVGVCGRAWFCTRIVDRPWKSPGCKKPPDEKCMYPALEYAGSNA
eukprot:4542248-Prymnesium_polylepis.1